MWRESGRISSPDEEQGTLMATPDEPGEEANQRRCVSVRPEGKTDIEKL
jgi:hypothetical protein